VLPDLENMGIAVGISLLLLRTQPKIQVLYMYFRFMAAILMFDMDFCHLLSLYRRRSAALKNIIPITVSLTISLLH